MTIEFLEVVNGTELTLTHDRLAGADDRKSVSDGWTGLLGALETYLDG